MIDLNSMGRVLGSVSPPRKGESEEEYALRVGTKAATDYFRGSATQAAGRAASGAFDSRAAGYTASGLTSGALSGLSRFADTGDAGEAIKYGTARGLGSAGTQYVGSTYGGPAGVGAAGLAAVGSTLLMGGSTEDALKAGGTATATQAASSIGGAAVPIAGAAIGALSGALEEGGSGAARGAVEGTMAAGLTAVNPVLGAAYGVGKAALGARTAKKRAGSKLRLKYDPSTDAITSESRYATDAKEAMRTGASSEYQSFLKDTMQEEANKRESEVEAYFKGYSPEQMDRVKKGLLGSYLSPTIKVSGSTIEAFNTGDRNLNKAYYWEDRGSNAASERQLEIAGDIEKTFGGKYNYGDYLAGEERDAIGESSSEEAPVSEFDKFRYNLRYDTASALSQGPGMSR